jgi:hypothetical protein
MRRIDMDASTPAPQIGCLAMLAATAQAALLVTLGISTPLTGSIALYVPVFIVTGAIVGLVAAPLYGLARRYGRANVWTAIAAGALTGSVFPTLGALGDRTWQAWAGAAAFGMVGAAGGLSFFLLSTAPATPLRNAAAIFVITAVSIVATVLSQPHLM